MNPQETIGKMLAVKGDILFLDKGKYCGVDLTTEPGVFWIMSRLEGWDRFEDFAIWVVMHSKGPIVVDHSTRIFMQILIWLATDAKDGKAPALFEALCEFTGVGK